MITLGSNKFYRNTWGGRERRRKPRRTEDLNKCVVCGVYFSWKSSSPICCACGHKLIAMQQGSGKIIDIFV